MTTDDGTVRTIPDAKSPSFPLSPPYLLVLVGVTNPAVFSCVPHRTRLSHALFSSNCPFPVVIHLRPVGDAPILSQTKFKAPGSSTVAWTVQQLRRLLKLGETDSVFVFVKSAFVPAPDECVYDLFKAFGLGNELVLDYSFTPAWG